ncbi:MAG: response regulator transcription factor [Calditrichaceae bacterium]|nr:response regulator transcription factor [Calditrichaceae bacterium]MBN2708585.1 response regulator transcription factor [Calditrichaceae bacterium]
MINVIITEDNDTIREGLALLINATEDMKCIARYGNCEDMLAALPDIHPDVFLQDIGLPGMSGIEGVKNIIRQIPEATILMLTVFEDEENIFKALKAGACGYLLKKTPPVQLIEAIKDAYQGGSPMSSGIARKVVTFFKQTPISKTGESYGLSEREKSILASLADGNSYKIIGDKLFISIDTVRSHIRNIYKKLHVHNQSEAVAKVIKDGII